MTKVTQIGCPRCGHALAEIDAEVGTYIIGPSFRGEHDDVEIMGRVRIRGEGSKQGVGYSVRLSRSAPREMQERMLDDAWTRFRARFLTDLVTGKLDAEPAA